MQETPNVFSMAMARARHAASAQALASHNIANADTPGYLARRLPDFAALWRGQEANQSPRATRDRHLLGRMDAIAMQGSERSPNGNDVSLEAEMFASVSAARAHNRAMAIYRSHLTVLKSAVARS